MFNKVHCINVVNCFFSQSSTSISFNNTFYRWILLDNVGTNIYDYFWTKTTFMYHVRQRRHFSLFDTTFRIPTFEDKGRLHAYQNKIKIDCCQGNPSQVSRLVHRILQGVEHTDPTEWSNSHLSIGDKFVMAVQWTASFWKGCSLFFFSMMIQSFTLWRLRNIHII